MRSDSQRSERRTTTTDDELFNHEPTKNSLRNYDEPTRLKTMVCPDRPNIKDEVRRRMDRRTMDVGG